MNVLVHLLQWLHASPFTRAHQLSKVKLRSSSSRESHLEHTAVRCPEEHNTTLSFSQNVKWAYKMQLLSSLPSHVLHKALGVRPRLHYKQGGTTALREGEAPTAHATNDGSTQRTPPNGFSSSQEPRRRSAAEGGAASHSNFPSRSDVLSAVASTTLVLALTGQALRMVAPIASPAVWLGHADALQHYLSQGAAGERGGKRRIFRVHMCLVMC